MQPSTSCLPCPAPVRLPLQGWNCVQVFEGHSHYVMQVRLGLGFLGG